MKGFVKIPRRLFDTKWWHQRRIYSESDAILDIYQSADKENIFSASIRALADRWQWEQTRVLRFLARLTKDGYIKTEKSKCGTSIRLLDFGAGATPGATPSATPKPLSTKDSDDASATPNATPNATPRAYKNDNIIISCLKQEDNKKDSSLRSESEEDYSFDRFWNLYDKKVDRKKVEPLYAKLSLEDKKAIFENLPKYIESTPNKKYRKNPQTYINGQCWNDEIINDLFEDATQLRDNDDPNKFIKGFSW